MFKAKLNDNKGGDNLITKTSYSEIIVFSISNDKLEDIKKKGEVSLMLEVEGVGEGNVMFAELEIEY